MKSSVFISPAYGIKMEEKMTHVVCSLAGGKKETAEGDRLHWIATHIGFSRTPIPTTMSIFWPEYECVLKYILIHYTCVWTIVDFNFNLFN